MRITKKVLYTVATLASHPFETGGILGSCDRFIVDEVVIDLPESIETHPCSYFPNVDFLNKNIEAWQDRDIYFVGIFHTHFGGAKNLSCEDKKYIKTILDAMPKQIGSLYFPIYVLPDEDFICYKATRLNGGIDISEEKLQITD